MPHWNDDHDEEEEYCEEQEQIEEQECEEAEQEWRASTCEGNRKALLVGINYFNAEEGQGRLNGCINDVNNVKQFLLERGYEEENMRVLTDDAEDPEAMPTKENMIDGMNWLVEDAAPDDALFFHFSGHGGHQVDEDNDEADGRDENICPYDFQENGTISDDEIHARVVAPLPIGCRLTILFDCCHSGSGADLPFMYTEDGEIKSPTSKQDQMESIAHHANSNDEAALTLAVESLKFSSSENAQYADAVSRAYKSSQADVLFLSGCQDEQTSTDAVTPEGATGALSHALIKFLGETPDPTWLELLAGVRALLEEDNHAQRPQLSSSHPMNLDVQFIC